MPPFARARADYEDAVEKLAKLGPDTPLEDVDALHEAFHVWAEVLAKQDDDDEPRSFEDNLEEGRFLEIDGAFDRRLHALLATTTEIMRSDVDDREALILAAVNEYAATMERDVPELFAGRLAKWLVELAIDDPEDAVVEKILTGELEAHGLLPDTEGDSIMKFLEKLSKSARAAFDSLDAEKKAEDVFKGASEDLGIFVGALLERIVGDEGLEAELGKAQVAFQKAIESGGHPQTELEKVLKGVTDLSVRNLLEAQAVALKSQGKTVADLVTKAERRELAEMAKAWTHLPSDGGTLVDCLQKAKAAGFLDTFEKILTSAQAQAAKGKAFDALAADMDFDVEGLGAGDGLDPGEAHEAIVAKAAELRKGKELTLSAEKAYELACEQNSALYTATRGMTTS